MIDYHDDDCDCIECEARRRHGLPSDDDEWDRHEEKVFNSLATCPSRKEIKDESREEPKMPSEVKRSGPTERGYKRSEKEERPTVSDTDEKKLAKMLHKLRSALLYSEEWLALQQEYRDYYIKVHGEVEELTFEENK